MFKNKGDLKLKKIELEASNENLIKMLERDVIKRNQYIRKILEMLDNVDDNFTIFINGDWGTGKTFLIKQTYILLTYFNEYIKQEMNQFNQALNQILQKDCFKDLKLSNNFVPIYYNAWNNDSHIDPINSIIFNIIKEHNIFERYSKESSSIIDKLASTLDTINLWSNGSIKELISTFKGKDTIPEITTMENLKQIMNDLLDELLAERGDKLVVFIDELDRCNPIYAIKLLERIKHFFNHENIIFIFSVNVKELTNTISNYYGQNFDSHKYLNKFCDISIDLPIIDITTYMEFLGFNKESIWFKQIVFEFINVYNFTMRDCIRYYQSLKLIEAFVETPFQFHFSEEQGKEVLKSIFLPILLGIKIINLEAFIDIINGNGYDNFFSIINKLDIAHKALYYYMDKDGDKKISKESFKKQLFSMYNAVFNKSQYTNNEITLNTNSYNYIMEALNLLKKDLKYK